MSHHPDLTTQVVQGLGLLYLILFLMNAYWTYRLLRDDKTPLALTAGWAILTAILGMLCAAHYTGGAQPEHFAIRMPGFVKGGIDKLMNPVIYFFLSIALYIAMIVWRKVWIGSWFSWILLNLAILFMGLSMTDYDFRQIVCKPDNVPIVAMLFIVGFFTWLYFRRAVENDERIAAGRPLLEQDDSEKVLVWPDLVYTEMICMVIVTAVLIAWAVLLQAPLEEPASAVKTPNPSKAPWYFLGLQEMLVYYDPWMAGVVLPSVILVGLMALPYIDFNKLGNGYYTFAQRKFAISTFLFGFMPLWIGLIVLGTFLRGPNWNIFGIFEPWDVHKLEVLNNINLSDWFWVDFRRQALPTAASGSSFVTQAGVILLRESVGLVAVMFYLLALPPLLAMTVFRSMFVRMGFIRYMVLANMALLMACLPIKMLLRWAFNLKYIVAIPEWFFNI